MGRRTPTSNYVGVHICNCCAPLYVCATTPGWRLCPHAHSQWLRAEDVGCTCIFGLESADSAHERPLGNLEHWWDPSHGWAARTTGFYPTHWEHGDQRLWWKNELSLIPFCWCSAFEWWKVNGNSKHQKILCLILPCLIPSPWQSPRKPPSPFGVGQGPGDSGDTVGTGFDSRTNLSSSPYMYVSLKTLGLQQEKCPQCPGMRSTVGLGPHDVTPPWYGHGETWKLHLLFFFPPFYFGFSL